MELDKFEQLASKVDLLLGRITELKDRKAALERELEEKDNRVKTLENQVESMTEQRSLVLTKVDELLDRIEQQTDA
jgi:uncharacterized protein YoxC